MPTYEYRCRSCGEHLEVVQSFKDEPLTECPACKGELKKVFSPIGIAFKGSGFYRNDSRAGAGAKSASTGDSGAGSSDSASSSSSTSPSTSTSTSTPSSSGSSEAKAASA